MKTVLVHGLGQTAESWNKTRSAMPPHAEIECPQLFEGFTAETPNWTALYHRFSEYCDRLPAPFNLCGLSLGGMLSLKYTIDHPERIGSLVLICTPYAMPRTLLKVQRFAFRLTPDRLFRNAGLTKADAIALTDSMTDLDFQEALPRITMPALVVYGGKDLVNRRLSHKLHSHLPHAQLQCIMNAGHEINMEAPKKLGAILTDFFKL